MNFKINRESIYEGIGTALLAFIVSASGFMGYLISGGNDFIALIVNSLITGIGLYCLIVLFRPLSGAQFNPLVSILLWVKGKRKTNQTILNIFAQIVGAIFGILLMHILYDLPVFQISTNTRSSLNLGFSEFVSSIVLLLVILRTINFSDTLTAKFVSLTVAVGIWVTSSTFFANPALTIARSLTNTYVGIRFEDVSMFIVFQLLGIMIIIAYVKYVQPYPDSIHK